MDKRYEVYCLADSLFYDAPTRPDGQESDFELVHEPVPSGWSRSELESWIVFRPDGIALPAQGWKVHVSADLSGAVRTLRDVWTYCRRERVAFKFLRDRVSLLLANAKYADRGASGKFVTLYPADSTQLRRVLEQLGEVLDGRPGPYVLSDLRWGHGPLYVRYGGFAERWCLSEAGDWELAVEDESGRLVPDLRGPTFQVPDWVQLPEFLRPHLEARNGTTVADLPYSIERALHFSNGGGLYVGVDTRDADRVVLKEARPHAGLTLNGDDSVTRLRRERDVLQQLAGLDCVPNIRDYFCLGDHEFLVQEFVPGDVLSAMLVDRNPITEFAVEEPARTEYRTWALGVVDEVEHAVAAVHRRDVVIGDLHPSNILVRPDGRPVLVDFEGASFATEDRRQALADPAFLAPADRTGEEVDAYALACLRLFVFLPLTSLVTLSPGKAGQLARTITEVFGVPADDVTDAVRTISTGPVTSSDPPEPRPDPEGWCAARDSMARAILASATPERDDRLFPGDIEQFGTGGLNIAHGAAGVLHALAATGAGRHPRYEEWLVRHAHRPSRDTTRLGFYDGLHGVAHVLDGLGHRTAALDLVESCDRELRGKWERFGLDLYGGLAGIVLNLLHLARETGESRFRATALDMADVVAVRLGDGDRPPRAGLLRGSSGLALMFLGLFRHTEDGGFLDLAANALHRDLAACLTRPDGSLEVDEGWRTMPYLAEGSVGIGMVLDEYLRYRDDAEFADRASAIRRAAEAVLYIQSDLFGGRAGMIAHLSRAHAPGTAAEHDPVVASHVRRLAWHALDFRGHLAFPGEQLLRLSMDLGTGTAGVLLALGAALHDRPVHLPFLEPLGSSRTTSAADRPATGPSGQSEPPTSPRRTGLVDSREGR